MSGIQCGQCGHVNEDLTRVFCQNCGTRLTNAPENVPTAARPAQKGKRRAALPGWVPVVLAFFRRTVGTALTAVLIALTIQIVRAPSGLPPATSPDETQAALFYNMLRMSSESQFVESYTMKQADVNNYLAERIVVLNEDSTENVLSGAKFRRAFVVMTPGKVQLFVERTFLGVNVFVHTGYVPKAADGGMTAVAVGGGIGRVPVHPIALKLVAGVVDPIVEAIAEPMEVLRRADQIVVGEGEAQISWPRKNPASG